MRLLCCRLCISCDNAQYGCTTVLKLDSLPTHLEECEHNPKRPVPCEQGCGLIIPMDELKVSMQGHDTEQSCHPTIPVLDNTSSHQLTLIRLLLKTNKAK